tara:strand:- start:9200 stop:12367 length:3168 start_codon:yes stop_codon:yes gene_type:complete
MGGAEGKLAFKQVGAVDLVLNTDQYIRELRGVYQAKNVLDQKDSQNTIKAIAQTDQQIKSSFDTLESELKDSQKVHEKVQSDIIAGFQTQAIDKPDMPESDIHVPEIADEYNAELMAMEQNYNNFQRRMKSSGYDLPADQGTIEADIGASMGGDPAQRKASQAAMEGMIKDEEQIQRKIKNGLKLHARRVETLEHQRESLLGQARAIRDGLDKSKMTTEEYDEQIKQAKKLEGQAGYRTTLISKENEEYDKKNLLLAESKRREEDIVRTKERGKGVDMALSAADREKQQRDAKYWERAKRNHKTLVDFKQREIQLAKQQSRLMKQYADQVDAMSRSIGTTLAGAIGLSTAAFAAMKMKLDPLVSSFQAFEKEIINAQSIFQTSNDTLFALSDDIVHFGSQYGISMDNAATGLYQLASAGLSAEESMMVLNNTLKLSMAVQGDHNTISKLTTQTIFGFGLEMSDAALLTDKFAHAINKSLIEYQDLASAVKFAMPFFVATGQSVDQLLGSIEILTNRALEAGIAGRGLRQALAEFAQHADDNTVAFARMGVQVKDNEGNFKQLTEIAKDFQLAMGDNTGAERLTVLLESLNVRGATAFVHLVENADEFQAAVDDLQNSAGAATEMAEIQQQSLENQIQRVKNALMAPFLLSDEVGKANGVLNEFALTLHNIVSSLEGMFVVVEDGVITSLTPLGEILKDQIITAMKQIHIVMVEVVMMFQRMAENGTDFGSMLNMITVPLRLAVKVLGFFGSEALEAALILRMINGVMPITNMLTQQMIRTTESYITTMQFDLDVEKMRFNLQKQVTAGKITQSTATKAMEHREQEMTKTRQSSIKSMQGQMFYQISLNALQFANIYLMRKYAEDSPVTAAKIGILSGSLMGLAFAMQAVKAGAQLGIVGFAGYMAAGAALMGTMNYAMTEMMKPPEMEEFKFDDFEVPDYTGEATSFDYGTGSLAEADLGMRLYDSGGALGSRHSPVLVEPGETITSKTQNMVNGGANGITIIVEGNVYDNERFAESIADVLPEALRQSEDIGAYTVGMGPLRKVQFVGGQQRPI